MNVLLAYTGSVATILSKKIEDALLKNGHNLNVVLTKSAEYFYDNNDLTVQAKVLPKIYRDKDEFPSGYYKKEDIITHIYLRDWADVLLIAPCSANTMAKMANGICDNLLTSVFRAWDFNKPVYIAPSMNMNMWTHPVVQNHIETLKKWNVKIIYPTVKESACGQYGVGAMADITTIVDLMEGYRWRNPFSWHQCDLNGINSTLFIPLYPHPGSFGIARHYHFHTGVDIYIDPYVNVYPLEEGEVVSSGQFTGEEVGSPHFNKTWYVSVKGKSGIICYGEIEVDKNIEIGSKVTFDTILGKVLVVLKRMPRKPVPNHKSSMLHVELMRSENNDVFWSPDWEIGNKKPKCLIDPTQYLYLI